MKTPLIHPTKALCCALSVVALTTTCTVARAQLKIDYGKSYVNLTKGTAGGTIEPGDTLEIRATFVVGGSGANDYADSCAYFDVVPANTSYIPSTLSIRTNEGKIYKSFTDAPGDDAGWISGSNVVINLGYKNAPTATAFRRGRIKYNDKPSFFGSTCIMIASYRVVVTGAYGSKISLGGGTISYLPFGASLTSITFSADTVVVFKNFNNCSNTAINNAILSEFSGTFGSGTAKNRFPSSKVSANYTYAPFSSNMPNDYYYAISNNTSAGGGGYTTSNAWAIPDNSVPAHRVFALWDIIGDHTGAANPLLGNPATDTTAGPGGYMAVINSSYKTGIAFLDTITNLCPNTYYQYYAWIRNICSKCACDSNGKGATQSGYIPTATGDSSGVYPNLTFNVNGYDYYTTGNIMYTGQWVRKSFVYRTGPAETSMVIYIRNNAPGGGGNDWAIDDIGVSTCAPTISLSPNKPDTLCQGSDDTVRFKITAYFANYTEWKLERSTDGGISWSSPGLDTLGMPATGSATPLFNAGTGLYEWVVTRYYRLNLTDTLIKYRLTVASTPANLASGSCSYVISLPKIIRAMNCNIVLPVSIALRGRLEEQSARLQWLSTNETINTRYIVERSHDESHWQAIGTLAGTGIRGAGNTYQFTDPDLVDGQVYYRINIADNDLHVLSKIILLSREEVGLELRGLVNPFRDRISFDLTAPADQNAGIRIVDAFGRQLYQETRHVSQGLNNIRIYGLDKLPGGFYVIQVRYADRSVAKSLIKLQQ